MARWQHVVLDVRGRALHVVNLHLSSPLPLRREALTGWAPLYVGEDANARRLEVGHLAPRLQSLAAGPEPLIVAGDMNLTDQTPEYARLREAGLEDAQRSVGWGFGHTFPSSVGVRLFHQRLTVPFPLLGIDHVMYSSRVEPRAVRVWPTSGGSDHLPVVADLALRP
jgi:endonuclease/exonuclease/phosphatase family metal-dependent hydrolase